jgi:hypothetical protein
VIQMRLIGPSEEVEEVLADLGNAVRVGAVSRGKSRRDPDHVLVYATVETLLPRDRPGRRRTAARG